MAGVMTHRQLRLEQTYFWWEGPPTRHPIVRQDHTCQYTQPGVQAFSECDGAGCMFRLLTVC